MNIFVKVIFSVALLFLVSGYARTDTEIDCDAPETIKGYGGFNDYNEFVCVGIQHMQEKKYKEAVKSFEAALAIPLFEIPNFELLPRLAWAYFKAGDLKKSENTLVKAELSLSVYTWRLKCNEVEDGFYLSDNWGRRLTGKNVDEVIGIMCGGAYEYLYIDRSLEYIPFYAELVKRYLDVKQRIEEASGK